MLLFCMPVAAAMTLPEVALSWKGEDALLALAPPVGFEISADAPADLAIRWADSEVGYSVSGRRAELGVALWSVRGREVEGDLSITLCDKADGVCQTLALQMRGSVPTARRGRVTLGVVRATPPAEEAVSFRTDAQALASAAFAAVEGTERRVLLDFSAVWCPPCNALAAEVLHAAQPPEVLEAYEVVVLDVDDPRSWVLKDRYQIGSYPTVVIADAQGREIGREVGFPGAEPFLAWLEQMAARNEPAVDYAEVDPATVSPERAGEIAWELTRQGRPGVAPWIARAEAGEVSVALRLARVNASPTLEDASWLAEHAPEETLEWISAAMPLFEEEAGRAVLDRAIAGGLAAATGPDAAALLYFAARAGPPSEAPLRYGAAAAALRASFSGDPARDRAHYTFLASLMAKSGDLEGALARLRDATVRWPEEPTFLLKEARLLLDAGEAEAALTAAEGCVDAAWGDNRLRCGALVCEALTALDRADDAARRARELLDAIAAPDPALEVRSPRYRKALQAFVDAE